uniref:Ig-like domain-containing protein n=1 Tax=Cyprinus carpio TaxID=7962 RepID=A0A8C1TFK0_CYPCA
PSERSAGLRNIQDAISLYIYIYFLSGVATSVLGFSELSFSVEPTDVTASLGERVLLDCQAQGESPVSLRWRRDGVQLQESGGVRVLSNGSLFISSSAPADQGFYQCLARNRHGAVLSRTSQLTVSGACAQPSKTHPTRSEQTVQKLCLFSKVY